MSRVVPDYRHRASCMGDGPNGRYHIHRAGCAQACPRESGGRRCAWPSPRAGGVVRYRRSGFREPPGAPVQIGSKAGQGRPSAALLLRSWSLRVWASPFADRSRAQLHRRGASMIPMKSADRVKTDRARRAGTLRSRRSLRRRMNGWPAAQAGRVLRALIHLGWTIERQRGSHRTLSQSGWPDYVFAFPDSEELGAANARAQSDAYRPAARRSLAPQRGWLDAQFDRFYVVVNLSSESFTRRLNSSRKSSYSAWP
jgi:hypothetical protein